MFAQNPISPFGVYIADPSARVMPDGKLYIYGSKDENRKDYCSKGYHVLSSFDLKHWNIKKEVFSSCKPNDNGGSTSSSEGMLGEIPAYYEKQGLDFCAQVSEIGKASGYSQDQETVEKVVKLAMDLSEKSKEEGKTLADKLIGKVVSYQETEGLPYKVVSDVTITDIELPSFTFNSFMFDELKVELKYQVVATEDISERYLFTYCFVTDTEGNNLDCASFTGKAEGNPIAAGDTVTVADDIKIAMVSADVLNKFHTLKFVSEATYEEQRETINKQMEQWIKEYETKMTPEEKQ